MTKATDIPRDSDSPEEPSLVELPMGNSPALVLVGASLQQAMASIACWLHAPRESFSMKTVMFVNMHNYNVANLNGDALKCYKAMDYVFADGVALQVARWLLRLPRFARVSGTEVVPNLLLRYVPLNCRVFLLGGTDSLIDEVAANFCFMFPRARLAGSHHGYFQDADDSAVVAAINASGAELLLVGMGSPRQEMWLQKNRHELNTTVAVCVGGLFHYWNRSLSRAPPLLRALGLEWLSILIQQPSKWHRYSIGAFRFFSSIAAKTRVSHH